MWHAPAAAPDTCAHCSDLWFPLRMPAAALAHGTCADFPHCLSIGVLRGIWNGFQCMKIPVVNFSEDYHTLSSLWSTLAHTRKVLGGCVAD